MQYTQHENETGESLAESTQKLFPIDARTVQYFGECLLYNSNSIEGDVSNTSLIATCAPMSDGRMATGYISLMYFVPRPGQRLLLH